MAHSLSRPRRRQGRRFCVGKILPAALGCLMAVSFALGQAAKDAKTGTPRSSMVEDRAARKLIEAGDLRMDAGESDKGLDLWRSVIERYPRSKLRFLAHMKLGEHHLTVLADHVRARAHFEAVYSVRNPDEDQRALALLKNRRVPI